MRKQFLIAVGFVISTAASAQEWKAAIEKMAKLSVMRGC